MQTNWLIECGCGTEFWSDRPPFMRGYLDELCEECYSKELVNIEEAWKELLFGQRKEESNGVPHAV